MKRTSIFNKLLSLIFAVTVVYTVSVREVHYLFAQHETHEHCENHLHSDEHHEDCSVCKFDISLFTDVVYAQSCNTHQFLSAVNDNYHSSVILYSALPVITLRGPPIKA